MKVVIIVFSIFLPVYFFGQPTRKITKKEKNRKEVYFVLKSDKDIRHGPYHKFGCGDQVYVEGYYKNGLKDSIWKEYGSHGKYIEGKRIGIWEFRYANDEIEQIYDYTNDTLLYYLLDSLSLHKDYKIIIGADTIRSPVERPPLYIGGGGSIIIETQLENKIEYPKKAKRKRISGEVIIAFTVDTNRVLSNYKVIKGLGYGIDEVALNSLKNLPDDWLPAIKDGQRVTVEIDFHFIYKLVKKRKK